MADPRKIGRALRKYTKAQAEYGPGNRQQHCGICRHFQPPERCEIVEGEIRPEMWCKYWEPRNG